MSGPADQRRTSPYDDLLAFLAANGSVALVLFLAAPGASTGLMDAIVVLFLFPAIVWASTGVELRGLASRISSALGAASYAIYVLHLPALGLVAAVSSRRGDLIVAHAPYSGLLVLALLAAACWLLDRFYDLPVRKWLRDRLARPSRRPRPIDHLASANMREVSSS
jgi:peptidoglycan/LPS O-acetylase OafA/YrhL